MIIRNGRVKRRIGTVLSAALVGSLLAFASPAAAPPFPYPLGPTTEAGTLRLAGDDRYETAAAVATSRVATTRVGCDPYVVIANGENFPDGLAASVLGGLVLLVRSDSIPAATVEAIQTMQTVSQAAECSGDVYIDIVGGPSAVSSAVREELKFLTNGTGGYVRMGDRFFGANRYETAIAVAEYWEECDHILATGENFPDALAAGPLAIHFENAILLNSGAALRADVKAYLAGVRAQCGSSVDVTIVGGTSAVPASVEAELLSMGINVSRLAGDNRYETAAAIADELVEDGYPVRSVVLVNGSSFADALSAGTFATLSTVQGVVLLTNADSIPDATEQFHVENCSTLGTDTGENLPADDDPTTDENIYGTVFAVGGTAVVSDGVLAGAGAATKCGDAIEVTSATISYDNVQDQACLVYDGVGAGWGDPETHNGPVLIPVPGSAADGLDPQITAVEIYGSDDPEATGGTVGAEFSGSILRVELGQDEHGMTQAEFAEIWASIPPAAATFAVVLGSSDPFGPPNAGSSDVSVYCTETAADYVIEITFNQPVGRYNNFETTPNEMLGSLRLWETTDGAREGLPTPDSASPLFNVADPSGNAVFTYTWEALPYSYLFECGLPFDIEEGEEEYICLPEVGDDFSIFSDEPSPEVETSFGVHNRDFTVEFTAG